MVSLFSYVLYLTDSSETVFVNANWILLAVCRAAAGAAAVSSAFVGAITRTQKRCSAGAVAVDANEY